ncbi:hypothetical protein EUGRSUZ_A02004 [Eucalyptus grandis]|uniref:Uncharacterized protein n=2 Tax=Eucalyptus grandis TaxID=71139 RepID=A0ACC3M616_EUCGR|nr:hypothetical protein EUGRSUZ_A02004 [Eucalyptus grandis]
MHYIYTSFTQIKSKEAQKEMNKSRLGIHTTKSKIVACLSCFKQLTPTDRRQQFLERSIKKNSSNGRTTISVY